MIDREKRDLLAAILRHLCSGQISNAEFESCEGKLESNDPGIWPILNAAWQLYDLGEISGVGPTEAYEPVVARWILFLKSDLAYEWPEEAPLKLLWFYALRLASFGYFGRRPTFKSCGGDESVWPFFRGEDLEAANANPPYLARRGDV